MQELQEYLDKSVSVRQPQPNAFPFLENFHRAMEHDHNHEFETALRFYKEGVRQANEWLRHANNKQQKELISERLKTYSKRAQELQEYLEKRP